MKGFGEKCLNAQEDRMDGRWPHDDQRRSALRNRRPAVATLKQKKAEALAPAHFPIVRTRD